MHTEYSDLIAPAKWVYLESLQQASQKGSIFFYHGLGSDKDQQDKELYSLAQRGFLAIGIDNIGHGARRTADFDWQFSGQNPDFEIELFKAISLTAQEIPSLIDAYLQAGIIHPEKIGLMGVSMGGYIAYQAALKDKRIKAVTPILGSPHWHADYSNSPRRHPEHFFPTAILSQNAGLDLSVPPEAARKFHQVLQQYYATAPERQQYIEYPDSEHFMREADWHICWEQALAWLERFI